MVVVLRVAVLITDTVSEPLLATYARDPSTVRATPTGSLPTSMLWMTFGCRSFSMTETVPDLVFVT
jgi:hypothetical protein